MIGLKTKILNEFSRRWHYFRLPLDKTRPMTLTELRKIGLNRTSQYIYCDYYFRHFLPEEIRKHRQYFIQDCRGFGEDAFHAMWFILLQELKPKKALEIGVYRGQTVTLWKLISRILKFECSISCVSPFSSTGDSVRNYKNGIDYFEDTKTNHDYFNLPMPEVCRCLSTEPQAVEFIKNKKWDLIYIDGNHDYEVVTKDWQVCSESLEKGGIIVLDDSALYTDYKPPRFATSGHPGPSRLANEIPKDKFIELFNAGHNRVFQNI